MKLSHVDLTADTVCGFLKVSKQRADELEKKVINIQLSSYENAGKQFINFLNGGRDEDDAFYPEFIKFTNQKMIDCLDLAETREEELLIMFYYDKTDDHAFKTWQHKRLNDALGRLVNVVFRHA